MLEAILQDIAYELQEIKHEHNSQTEITLADLRIGLNLLGENGRLLLAQYIKMKLPKRQIDPYPWTKQRP
jgi:hypothetical protein